MNLKLEDYVIKLDSFINKKLCKKLIKTLEKEKSWKEHLFDNLLTGEKYNQSGSQELEVLFMQNKPHDELMIVFWHAINEYITKKINLSWFNSWNGYSQIRYNKYSENKKMALNTQA